MNSSSHQLNGRRASAPSLLHPAVDFRLFQVPPLMLSTMNTPEASETEL
jgi:hypothetical protein